MTRSHTKSPFAGVSAGRSSSKNTSRNGMKTPARHEGKQGIKQPPKQAGRISRTQAKRTVTVLPAEVREWLVRNSYRALGFVLTMIGFLGLVALIGYNPKDPSLHSVTISPESGASVQSPPVHNFLGEAGAFWADILLQTLGVAAFLLPIALVLAGIHMFFKRSLSGCVVRIPTILISSMLLALGFAQIPAPDTWALGDSLGGIIGMMLNGQVTGGLRLAGVSQAVLPLINTLVIVGLGGLGVFLSGWALALPWSGVKAVFGFVFDTIWNPDRFAAKTLDKRDDRQGAGDKAQSAAELRAVKRGYVPPHVDTDEDSGISIFAYLSQTLQGFFSRFERQDSKDTSTNRGSRKSPHLGHDSEADGKTSQGNMVANRQLPVKLQSKDKSSEKGSKVSQIALPLPAGAAYQLPSLSILQKPDIKNIAQNLSPDQLQKIALELLSVLTDFGVQGEITSISPGPVVTLFELVPAPGTKSSRVIGLADDIARSMSAVAVRVAVVPGKNAIGIELPNPKRQTVYFRTLLEDMAADSARSRLQLYLGQDIGGNPVAADLARMPHLLVAGTTGSGKSVAINTMILSLLYRLSPQQCRMIMIDPKMLELSIYNDIPHLLTPVVTEPKKAILALRWAIKEMEDRYRAMSKLGVRNIDSYNVRVREAAAAGEVLTRKVQTGFEAETGHAIYEEQPIDLNELPFIVIIVDEFADLMMVAGKDVDSAVQRLAQMARAAGIHLIMATQRPSVDVITGTIKANFPTRISFQVTSKIDSRTILGEGGAETLLGQGDMLYMAGGGRTQRLHGPFVSDSEVEKVVRHLKSLGPPEYVMQIASALENDSLGSMDEEEDDSDPLYQKAMELVLLEKKASTSFVQRHLQIGYNRAARIIERMEKEGVISEANHVGKREVLSGQGG